MPISPELAFQSAANHAATVDGAKPAYIRYTVSTHISIPSLHRHRDLDYRITTRTADDHSVSVNTDTHVRELSDHAFPFAPCFDALSDFGYVYGMNFHRTWFQITSIRPRRYQTIQSHAADVTAQSLRDYHVAYAPDSLSTPNGTTHMLLHPYQWYRGQSTYFFKEVWIDNASGLPSRIDFDGRDHLGLSFRYGFDEGHWVVQHAHLEQDMIAPFRLGKIHFYADADFSQIDFQPALIEPELQPAPQASPVAQRGS